MLTVLATASAFLLLLQSLGNVAASSSRIDRRAIVSRYNPTRNVSSLQTPIQVGNGGFAFGADVTGMQTFLPFAIMSSWAWKNDSLPPGKTEADILNYKGGTFDYHGRPLQLMIGGEPTMQQWMISNPNRVNLGRVGLAFRSATGELLNVTESDLSNVRQELDLWTGTLTSSFTFNGQKVTVTTLSAQTSNTVGMSIDSPLVRSGRLGVYLDFPWNDGKSKFSAPFVGVWNATANHTTTLSTGRKLGSGVQAQIAHTLDASTFLTSIGGDRFSISRDSPNAHRYTVAPAHSGSTFSFTVAYSTERPSTLPSFKSVARESTKAWEGFWADSGFVDVRTRSTDERAEELQRRIILSRYHLRVNEAADTPPQEVSLSVLSLRVFAETSFQSGLVNNGWVSDLYYPPLFHSYQSLTVRKIPHGDGILARWSLGTMEQLGSSQPSNERISALFAHLGPACPGSGRVQHGCTLVQDDRPLGTLGARRD